MAILQFPDHIFPFLLLSSTNVHQNVAGHNPADHGRGGEFESFSGNGLFLDDALFYWWWFSTQAKWIHKWLKEHACDVFLYPDEISMYVICDSSSSYMYTHIQSDDSSDFHSCYIIYFQLMVLF